MICITLNISEKIHWQHLFGKLGEVETHCLHSRNLKNNIEHPNKRIAPLFFQSDTNPVIGHILWKKTHVLAKTEELIWLLITFFQLCFNAKQIYYIRKISRLKLYKAPQLFQSATVKVTLLFTLFLTLFDLRYLEWPRSFFCICLSPMIMHVLSLFLLSATVAHLLLQGVQRYEKMGNSYP